MKKIFVVMGVFLTFCLFFVLFYINQPEKVKENTTSPAPLDTKPNLVYVVKEYSGNIAIFEENSEFPFKVTDIRLSELPDGDKKLLSKGIIASNSQELNCILEDYCS